MDTTINVGLSGISPPYQLCLYPTGKHNYGYPSLIQHAHVDKSFRKIAIEKIVGAYTQFYYSIVCRHAGLLKGNQYIRVYNCSWICVNTGV